MVASARRVSSSLGAQIERATADARARRSCGRACRARRRRRGAHARRRDCAPASADTRRARRDALPRRRSWSPSLPLLDGRRGRRRGNDAALRRAPALRPPAPRPAQRRRLRHRRRGRRRRRLRKPDSPAARRPHRWRARCATARRRRAPPRARQPPATHAIVGSRRGSEPVRQRRLRHRLLVLAPQKPDCRRVQPCHVRRTKQPPCHRPRPRTIADLPLSTATAVPRPSENRRPPLLILRELYAPFSGRDPCTAPIRCAKKPSRSTI